MSKAKKIVVFDLDETLGNFVELGMFCDALSSYKNKDITDNEFIEIMDMFPEFLRPNIVSILKYVMTKRKNGKCSKIMIYTNNRGPKEWSEKISRYFNIKTGGKTFNQIIAAFKVRGEIIEVERTTNHKSLSDLIKCANLPKNTEICFIDDQYHCLMDDNKVFYINIKPYIHNLPYREMAERYFKKIMTGNKEKFIDYIHNFMSKYNFNVIKKNTDDNAIDIIISKKLMQCLKDFFDKNNNQTRRKNHNIKSKTRKN